MKDKIIGTVNVKVTIVSPKPPKKKSYCDRQFCGGEKCYLQCDFCKQQ